MRGQKVRQLFLERCLGVQLAIPTWQTVRDWMRRIGLAMIKRAGKFQRATWIVDHSNQIGTEKLLVVLRVCRPHWTGNALGHQDVELIGLIPKTGWKASDVGKAYQQLAKQYGVPEAILVDDAAELRDGAEYLRKTGRKMLVRRDLKHFLANHMESLIGKDSRFSEFTKQVVSTRSAIQQTEFSHLSPASAKQKARFMNLQPTLKWASMILWQLDQPEAEGRSGVSTDRLEAKLGWLREYREDIEQWLQCKHVVSLGVKLPNEQGIYQGASGATPVKVLSLCDFRTYVNMSLSIGTIWQGGGLTKQERQGCYLEENLRSSLRQAR